MKRPERNLGFLVKKGPKRRFQKREIALRSQILAKWNGTERNARVHYVTPCLRLGVGLETLGLKWETPGTQFGLF